MTRNPRALRRIATVCLIAGLMATRLAHADVSLNFVNADIDQVAKAIGAATGKTIIVDPRVKGQLNLVAERPVPEDQAIKTLESALRMQGFALVQDHGVLKVVPEADAKLQGVPTYVGNTPAARGDQVITQVFELHNESANNLLPVLRPLISPNNTIAAYPANNTLVVTDYADNVRRIAAIIAGVDSAAGQQIEVVPLKNANAVDTAQALGKMLDPGAIGSTDATLKVSVQADSRSNSLLIRASNKARIAIAKKLAQQLDAPSSEPGNIHVVHLRNANAVALAKTLRGMMGKGAGETAGATGASAETSSAGAFNVGGGGGGGGGGLSTGTSGTPPLPSSFGGGGGSYGGGGSMSGGRGGGGISSEGFLGQRQGGGGEENPAGGMIQADSATNSLIITASDPVYRNLRAVIDQLDERRAQVYIEALIVELQAQTGANLGIQWQGALLSSGNNNGVYAGSNFGSGNSNIIGLTTTGATIAQNPTTGLAAATAAGANLLPNGLNIGYLHQFGKIFGLGGLLQALASSNDSNVLSSPNLLTLDNEEAKIIVGQNVPILSNTLVAPSGAATGITQSNSYDRYDVGTVLHIKPQITDGGILKLQLYTEVSAVDPTTINAPGGYTINKRSINSTVLVDTGDIIALGGLMNDNYSTTVSKVPLLGDIPWVGQLFRSESKSRTKDNLMVFLRPVIVRDQQDMASISSDRYDYMRSQQQGYQGDNRLIKDYNVPELPPAPPGSSEGANPAQNLFDLRSRTRQPALPQTPAAPPNSAAPASGQPPAPAPDATVGSAPAAAPSAPPSGGRP